MEHGLNSVGAAAPREHESRVYELVHPSCVRAQGCWSAHIVSRRADLFGNPGGREEISPRNGEHSEEIKSLS